MKINGRGNSLRNCWEVLLQAWVEPRWGEDYHGWWPSRYWSILTLDWSFQQTMLLEVGSMWAPVKKTFVCLLTKKDTHGFGRLQNRSFVGKQRLFPGQQSRVCREMATWRWWWRHGGDGGDVIRPMSWSVAAPCHGGERRRERRGGGCTAVL